MGCRMRAERKFQEPGSQPVRGRWGEAATRNRPGANRGGKRVSLKPPYLLLPAVAVRSQRATGIGRLMVNVVEGIELKPCRSHGKDPEVPPARGGGGSLSCKPPSQGGVKRAISMTLNFLPELVFLTLVENLRWFSFFFFLNLILPTVLLFREI